MSAILPPEQEAAFADAERSLESTCVKAIVRTKTDANGYVDRHLEDIRQMREHATNMAVILSREIVRLTELVKRGREFADYVQDDKLLAYDSPETIARAHDYLEATKDIK